MTVLDDRAQLAGAGGKRNRNGKGKPVGRAGQLVQCRQSNRRRAAACSSWAGPFVGERRKFGSTSAPGARLDNHGKEVRRFGYRGEARDLWPAWLTTEAGRRRKPPSADGTGRQAAVAEAAHGIGPTPS